MEETILVVDPREDPRRRLVDILKGLDYAVVTAGSSVQGQSVIENEHASLSLAIVANTSLAGSEDIVTRAGRYDLPWLVIARDSDVLPRQLTKHVLRAEAGASEIRDVVAARIAQGK